MHGHHLNLQASFSIRKIATHLVVTVLINLHPVFSPPIIPKIVNKNPRQAESTTFGRYQVNKAKHPRRHRK